MFLWLFKYTTEQSNIYTQMLLLLVIIIEKVCMWSLHLY